MLKLMGGLCIVHITTAIKSMTKICRKIELQQNVLAASEDVAATESYLL